MKTNLTRSCLAAILLVGMAMPVFAQNNIVTAEQADIMNAALRQTSKDSDKRAIMNFLMSGDQMGQFMSGFLRHDDFREGIGISQEQYQKILEVRRNFDTNFENDPDYKSLQMEERPGYGDRFKTQSWQMPLRILWKKSKRIMLTPK